MRLMLAPCRSAYRYRYSGPGPYRQLRRPAVTMAFSLVTTVVAVGNAVSVDVGRGVSVGVGEGVSVGVGEGVSVDVDVGALVEVAAGEGDTACDVVDVMVSRGIGVCQAVWAGHRKDQYEVGLGNASRALTEGGVQPATKNVRQEMTNNCRMDNSIQS
jgi:hypothetical protein